MNICLNCNNETTNPKFCSRSCAASFNNKLFPKKHKNEKLCSCGTVLKKNIEICVKCEKAYLKNKWYIELKPLVDSGKSSRRLANILGISQTTLRNRLDRCGLKLQTNNFKEHTCFYCNETIIDKKTNFCSNEHKYLYYKNSNYYKLKYNKGKDIREQLILQLGNMCSICGYNKNSAALVFHHKKQEDKAFSITTGKCTHKSIEDLQKEISKCILLCANCHAEIHHPNCDLNKVVD